MGDSPSSEYNACPMVKTFHLLQSLKGDHICRKTPLIPTINQTHPVHTSHFISIRKIFMPSYHQCHGLRGLLHSGFLTKICTYFLYLTCMLHDPSILPILPMQNTRKTKYSKGTVGRTACI